MFENLLRNPATKLKNIAVRNFKSTVILSIIICLALGITVMALWETIGIVIGILVIVFGPIIACGNSYLNTLQILCRLEMMENVESIEDDTEFFRNNGIMTKPYTETVAEAETKEEDKQNTAPSIVTKKSSYLEQFGI